MLMLSMPWPLALFYLLPISWVVYHVVRIKQHTEQLHTRLTERQLNEQQHHQTRWQQEQQLLSHLKDTQQHMQETLSQHYQVLTTTLQTNSEQWSQHIQLLQTKFDQRLNSLSHKIDTSLHQGFDQTHSIVTEMIKRFALIDQAQQRLTHLSSSVTQLQTLLSDKKTRGVWGEVQLQQLIKNVMPPNSFAMQYTLSNGKRADCMLLLPEPNTSMVIDAKFPLESYRSMTNSELSTQQHALHQKQFRQDIQYHIRSIHDKYIIRGETADSAMMFIPAESIFAEIHAHYPDLVEFSHQLRIWLVSPTTMMAVLTAARSILKDTATRQQIHVIQEHLIALSKDFTRFQKRVDLLARHIRLAHQDIDDVHRSSQKISQRFNKIEQVECHHKVELSTWTPSTTTATTSLDEPLTTE